MTGAKRKSLTYYVTRYDMRGPRLREFIEKYNMDPHVGQLPGALRERVADDDIPCVTSELYKCLDEFIRQNDAELTSFFTHKCYDVPSVGNLFNTPCVIECRNCGNMPWVGAYAMVYRIEFPEIGAQYAIKRFRRDGVCSEQGAWYEIPTGLVAGVAEPHDNNRVHMGSFGPIKYMLSDWAGDDEYSLYIRKNKNQLFVTVDDEIHAGNFRGGRRIDYGRTSRTAYGAATYRSRKIYRQLRAAALNADADTVTRIRRQYTTNTFLRRDFDAAIELVKQYAGITYEIWMARVLGDVTR